MDNHHSDGRLALWCNAPPGAQDLLVRKDPGSYFVPPYVGTRGWVGVRLDRGLDWDEITDVIEDAYHASAPRRTAVRPRRRGRSRGIVRAPPNARNALERQVQNA